MPNSSPPRWAEWWRDRSCSSEERNEASPARYRLLAGTIRPCCSKLAGIARAFSSTVVLTILQLLSVSA